eukprot:4559163-Prymnesium_polylepis.2
MRIRRCPAGRRGKQSCATRALHGVQRGHRREAITSAEEQGGGGNTSRDVTLDVSQPARGWLKADAPEKVNCGADTQAVSASRAVKCWWGGARSTEARTHRSSSERWSVDKWDVRQAHHTQGRLRPTSRVVTLDVFHVLMSSLKFEQAGLQLWEVWTGGEDAQKTNDKSVIAEISHEPITPYAAVAAVESTHHASRAASRAERLTKTPGGEGELGGEGTLGGEDGGEGGKCGDGGRGGGKGGCGGKGQATETPTGSHCLPSGLACGGNHHLLVSLDKSVGQAT